MSLSLLLLLLSALGSAYICQILTKFLGNGLVRRVKSEKSRMMMCEGPLKFDGDVFHLTVHVEALAVELEANRPAQKHKESELCPIGL